jgi:hypothetical protein
LAACMAAECGISRLVQLVPPAHHHFTLSQSSNRRDALFSYPVTTLLPPWLLHYLWRLGLMVGCLHGSRVRNFQTCTACASSAPPFYTFPELQQAKRIIPIPSNKFTAPLDSSLLAEVSWLAAYMAAECGISILVRLVPPAHHHFTLSESSNRRNALFSYPVTSLLPPWILHYLWRSHGWLPIWQQSAEFPDLYGLCLQRTTILHFPQAPTGLTHYSHAQ